MNVESAYHEAMILDSPHCVQLEFGKPARNDQRSGLQPFLPRWQWDEMNRRLGLGDRTFPQPGKRFSACSQQLNRRTRRPADTFRMVCTHRSLTQPGEFRAVEVNAQGREMVHLPAGGVCDLRRSVTVNAWNQMPHWASNWSASRCGERVAVGSGNSFRGKSKDGV